MKQQTKKTQNLKPVLIQTFETNTLSVILTKPYPLKDYSVSY